jgi:catechol 2,3-dioxygenase-like lactoylglutathione lyase family enzyme
VFDHVTIRVSDTAASERFYDAVLGVLGLERRSHVPWSEWGDFSISEVTAEHPLTRRLHIGFRADSRESVDEFWRVGTAAGYRDDGPPGPRPQYTPGYYGAFLVDPDGNSVEAVIHEEPRPPGAIDHLWIGVADLDASERFYEKLAPWTGFEPRGRHEFGVGFAGPGGSFSLIEREPTECLHVAFPALDDATVDDFHREALAAGYRDNGPPGERTIYHAGYYGAFVLDPDGNNVEVVNHNR